MKDDAIKFRIGKADKKKFLKLCKEKHLVPSNLLWHYVLDFVAEGEKKIQEKIKKGVSCVSRQILPLLTPPSCETDAKYTTI